ncbi:MAG: endonuclease [Bacteroidota bacterium]|nr:endonuclease [Bacteroidota bacterium]
MKKSLLIITMFVSFVSVFGQIPAGYYDGTESLTGESLKSALHNIIDDHQEYSYNNLRDFILRETDEDPNNSNNVILLYTGRSQPKNTFGGNANDWNREHVWAKSHGDFGNYPPCGTDAHHIRPTDASVNSSRGNKDFDNGGQQHNEATGCYYDGDSWEPRDEVKGDVARMIFYMATRYEGDNGEPDLMVVDYVNTSPQPRHGKLSTLLQWNEQDPVDDFEANRNEVVFGYQQNRNPFIDHPEFANKIWNYNTGISDITAEEFKVYPNPVNSRLTIEAPVDFNAKDWSVKVYSSLGKEVSVAVGKNNSKFYLDVRNLPLGHYFVTFVDGSRKQVQVRFAVVN